MKSSGQGPNQWWPNVYRAVDSDADLGAVSGAPARAAMRLILTNGGTAAEASEFKGLDGTAVSIDVPVGSLQLDGEFSGIGTLGTNTTCVAGWIDDGFPNS